MKSLKFLALAVAFGFMLSASAEEHLKSLNPAYFDKSTPAGEDFYKHVNKGWQESHPLTPEHARYGNFNILSDSSEARVKDIVLNLGATNPKPGPRLLPSRQIGGTAVYHFPISRPRLGMSTAAMNWKRGSLKSLSCSAGVAPASMLDWPIQR